MPAVAPDPTTPPTFLQLPAIDAASARRRSPAGWRCSRRCESDVSRSEPPSAALLGTVAGDPNAAPASGPGGCGRTRSPRTPPSGATEVWELYNATADAHPIHVHEVVFEVVDRQEIVVDEEGHNVQVAPGSTPTPPEPWETGFKDTVIAYPGEVTRIRAQFATPGQFVWHCHIVEHEDNEMMRPYRIGPPQPGQPA